MTRLTPLVCLATCLFARAAAAQLPPPPQSPRLDLSVGLTAMSPGPGARTEQALHAMGFRESYRPSMTQCDIQGFWKIEVGTSERRTLGIMKTRVANRTSGSVDLSGQGYAQVDVNHVVVTRAVTWSYRPNGWISVGAVRGRVDGRRSRRARARSVTESARQVAVEANPLLAPHDRHRVRG